MRTTSRIFALIATPLLLSFFTPQQVAAQDYLLDKNVKIHRHDKRTTPYRFPRGEKAPALDGWGMMFERSVWNPETPEEARLINYEKLPTCEKSDVALHEVVQYTKGTEKTDVLYYSKSDPLQRKRAAEYPALKIAYEPALMRDSSTNQAEYWQMFARFIQIDCLPTRFRFTYVGSQRYMEYRYGDAVWEPTSK